MISGDKFIVTGYYRYRGHPNNDEDNCFVTTQAHRLLFKKGETAPKLGSCDHIVEWILIKEYP